MSELADALDALVAEHRRIGSPLPNYLRPGAPADVAREQIRATVGGQPPDDLVDLFSWHDGTDKDAWRRDEAGTGFARFFGDTHFATLATAVKVYADSIETDEITARYSMTGTAPQLWTPSWFPAFATGDVVAVECDAASKDLGAVYDVNWHPPTSDVHVPRFRDLLHLAQSMVRRFEAGGYWWDPAERFLEEREKILDPLYLQEIAEARR